jgi:hypothetical protein
MKNTALFVFVILLIATVAHAQESPRTVEVTGADDLVKEKGYFAGTWVHPDADITQYSKLYPWGAEFQFRDVGETRSTATTSASLTSSGPYAISDEAKAQFEEIVKESFVKALGQSKRFEVVDQVGPDTLIVRSALLDIISVVPSRTTGVHDVHLSAVGEATFVFELIDAETGVIQARVAERRRIQPKTAMGTVSTVPTTSATVWAEVKLWANQVGQDLRRELDKTQKKAEKSKK